MLAALGMMPSMGCGEPKGIRPDRVVKGIQPDQPPPLPPKKETTVEERVIELISSQTGVEAKSIKRNDALAKYLELTTPNEAPWRSFLNFISTSRFPPMTSRRSAPWEIWSTTWRRP